MCRSKTALLLPLFCASLPGIRPTNTLGLGARDAGPDRRPANRLSQNAQTSGDNAWMLVSAALVLLMTGPGWRCFTAAWCGARTFWAP